MQLAIQANTLNGAFVKTRNFILRVLAFLFDQVLQYIALNLSILCHGDAGKSNDVRASRKWVCKASNQKNAVVFTKEYKYCRHSVMVDSKSVREVFLHGVTEFCHLSK